MAIRRREKPLTQSEAIELAKREFAPYWFGCPEPLMAGIRSESGARAYPLDPKMTERPWLIFFIDPFAASARDSLRYATNWAYRYEPQKLGVMVILRLAYPFARESNWGRKMAQQLDAPVVTVMDHEGLLSEALKAQTLPKLMLLHQNKIIFDKSGPRWFERVELELQTFLRRSDPGLPLFEPMTVPSEPVNELVSVDLGGLAKGTSSLDLPDGKAVTLAGNWTLEADRITTQDPQATLKFEASGKRVALIAQTLAERGETEMIVELQREYPRDGGLDEDLKLDIQVLSNPLADSLQKRRASAKLGTARPYYLFRALPGSHREVTLRFPSADKTPVAMYGLRLAD